MSDEEAVVHGLTLALVNMGVSDKANSNMWEIMYTEARDTCADSNDWKEHCRVAETQYVKDNVPEEERKYTSKGKLLVSEHLTSTWKQYKSRITTLFIQGHVLSSMDIPTASEAAEAIKRIKDSEPEVDDSNMRGDFILIPINVGTDCTETIDTSTGVRTLQCLPTFVGKRGLIIENERADKLVKLTTTASIVHL